jgi:hypothetical protein
MSSLSPVGWQPPTQVSGVEPTSMMSAPPTAYMQGTLDGVAGMLSMSTPDLRSALKQGSSIADIASQKGISRDAIVQSIEQQVQQQRAAQGKTPIDQQTLDQAVSRAVDRHRHGHHHQQGAGAATSSNAQQVTQPQGTAPQASLDVLA